MVEKKSKGSTGQSYLWSTQGLKNKSQADVFNVDALSLTSRQAGSRRMINSSVIITPLRQCRRISKGSYERCYLAASWSPEIYIHTTVPHAWRVID